MRELLVYVLVLALAFAAWWFYPTLKDMRDTKHLEAKCEALKARMHPENRATVEENTFYNLNCKRRGVG